MDLTSMRWWARRNPRAVRAAVIAVSVAAAFGCNSRGASLAQEVVDSAVVGTAQAATAPAPAPAPVPAAVPGGLWKERGPGEPLPPGIVPMPSLAPLVKVLKPGVVNIYSTSVVRARARRSPGAEDPFEEFFRRFHEGVPEESRRQSLGSGMLLSAKGYVLTNNHVVEGATEIKVKLDDGRELEAEVVGRDPKTDVALLKLKGSETSELPTVTLGDSDALQVGDFVLAAGNPFGLDHSVSMGIVSAKERVIGAGLYDDFIQTDAAINPGNSGGPLFNTRGEVVGINTAIVAQGQGIGFAVPINMVKELLPQLLEKHRVTRGWLGVSIQAVTPELAKMLKLDRPRGALIAGVIKKGPAEGAGIKAGDIVVSVNGRKVETYYQLSRYVAFATPGQKAQLTLVRDGKERGIDIRVGERPEDSESLGETGAPSEPASRPDLLGLAVQPVAPTRLQRLGVEGGVQVAHVRPDGPAARAGVRPGDVIVEVQRQPVRSMEEYAAAISQLSPGEMALIRLQRETASVYVAVRIPR
jgi:serine protease Do